MLIDPSAVREKTLVLQRKFTCSTVLLPGKKITHFESNLFWVKKATFYPFWVWLDLGKKWLGRIWKRWQVPLCSFSHHQGASARGRQSKFRCSVRLNPEILPVMPPAWL